MASVNEVKVIARRGGQKEEKKLNLFLQRTDIKNKMIEF